MQDSQAGGQMPDMITQVQDYIQADWYIRRAARYDVKAVAAQLTSDHPDKPLSEINGDIVWDVMQDNIICLHEPVAGSFMMVVDLEDLAEVARDRDLARIQPIECAKCDAWFLHDSQIWVVR